MKNFLKKFLNKNKVNNELAKDKWPTKPPRHSEDRDFLLNQYDAFGLFQFLQPEFNQKQEMVDVNLFTLILMENGKGERYTNILKNGIICTDTQLIKNSPEWKMMIQPWLNNETDYLPAQTGLMSAAMSQSLLELSKKIKNK